jgi:hypothetical protein
MYFTPLRYEKKSPQTTSCCYWSGPRHRDYRNGFATDEEGIRANL